MKRAKIIFLSSTIAFTYLLMSGCSSTEKFSYNTWDKDNNDRINKEEFAEVFKTHYSVEWKEGNNSETIDFDDAEFYRSSFAFWDSDDDNYIDPDEWDAVNDFYFNRYGFDDFVAIDDDKNSRISYEEYVDEIAEYGLFEGWDQDSDDKVTQEELAEGVFNSYDFDDTGYLEKGEFNTFASNYAEL